MEAPAAIQGQATTDAQAKAEGPALEPSTRRSRLTTLAVMGVTGGRSSWPSRSS